MYMPQNPMSAAAYRRQDSLIENLGSFLEKPVIPKYEVPAPRYIDVPNINAGVAGGGGGSSGGSDLLTKLMHAIAGQESGSRYNITNPDSGALGKYQIMPFNLGPWSKAAGLATPSRQQFLSDPNMQETIARVQFENALRQYGGNAGAVAAWWYGGAGGANSYLKGGGNANEGNYPSIRGYVASILRAMGM